MIEADKGGLLERARRLRRVLSRRAAELGAGGITVFVVETKDAVGGGAFPADTLPGYGVSIRSDSISAESLAADFRGAPAPVIAAIRDGSVVLHVRALLSGDEQRIATAFCHALSAPACPLSQNNKK
jgi:L-seryl-tRNA(Ser) seleniumtransferase